MKMKQLKKFVKHAEEAVSPVVATLMLVLVAAGAAVGFSVFMGAFQKDAQENVNSDMSTACLSIAGSSTIFEFTKVAKPLFENSQGGCDIINNAGGSGAGLQSVGIGNVDIGAMSHYPTNAELAKYPDLNQDGKKDFGIPDLKVTRVGFDAVVPVVPAGSCAAGADISVATYTDVWGINGEKAGHDATTNGADGAYVEGGNIGAPIGAKYTFEEVWPTSCAAPHPLANEVIEVVSRSDKGGTTDVFCGALVAGSCKAPVSGSNYPAAITFFADGTKLLGNQDAEARLAQADCANCLGYTSMAGDDTNANIDALTVNGVKATTSTVRDGSFVGFRDLVYLTIGEPQGTAKAYLDFVLLPKNNQEIAAGSGFVSLYP